MVWLFRSPVRCEFVKESAAAVTVFTTTRGRPTVGKFYARSDLGRLSLAGERAAHGVFGDRGWMIPVVRWHTQGLTVPRLPETARLDVAARTMTPEQRLDAAVWALDVLLEIYEAGYLHGDLQPHNAWFCEGRLVATDFETFRARTPGLPFLDSGDTTGNDPAPYPRPLDPAFDPTDQMSFHFALGVSLAEAVAALRARLTADGSPAAAARLAVLDGAPTAYDDAEAAVR